MVKYSIEIKRSAVKEIRKLPSREIRRILSAIKNLENEPRPHGCIKLTQEEKYRIRVGQYRILYSIENKVLVIYIVKIARRKDAYKGN